MNSEVAVWGPQLGTGLGLSQPPVRALAGAVVGAFNHWFMGSSQACVEPLELLVPDRPVRALRGRQWALRGRQGALKCRQGTIKSRCVALMERSVAIRST